MRKTLIISSLLAMVGAASAQTPVTAPATTAPAQVALTDVPAGHWAKDAVDRIVSCGLIQGFPDGTFRGNENLTRYQAALIFQRLLSSGALASCGFSQGDMTTIVNGMQEVSTELAALSARVGTLETANADQAARIAALEERITNLNTGAASTDVTALNARIDALEAAIKNIPAGPQGPKGDKGDKGDKGEPGAVAPATSTTVVTTPAPVVNPGTVVIGDVAPAMPASNNLFVGLSAGAKLTDINTKPCVTGKDAKYDANGKLTNATGTCLTIGAMVGSNNVFGPFGARVSAEYMPAGNSFNADVAATYNMGVGSGLGMYAGLGLGVTNSRNFNYTVAKGSTVATLNNQGSATDTYALGILGAEYRVTNNIAAFVEGNGRYYLSNKGYNTGLPINTTTAGQASAKGLNFGVKGGVKFYF